MRGLDLNATELCSGGMDLKTAQQKCPEPELKNVEYHSCVKYVECDGQRIGRLPQGRPSMSDHPGCSTVHGSGLIVCYEYVCKHRYASDAPGSGEGSGSEEGSGSQQGPGSVEGPGSDEEPGSEEEGESGEESGEVVQ